MFEQELKYKEQIRQYEKDLSNKKLAPNVDQQNEVKTLTDENKKLKDSMIEQKLDHRKALDSQKSRYDELAKSQT